MSQLGSISKRLWFGLNPEGRKSRFHTEKGQYALGSFNDVADFAGAVVTGIVRKSAGVWLKLPWITFPAMRFLRARITPTTRVFEWGCGMSTLWFERRCREVWAVEDGERWYSTISRQATKSRIFLLKERRQYVEKVLEVPPGYFNVISIDGSYRRDCFQLVLEHALAGALLIVDNTDKDRLGGDLYWIDQMLDQLGPEWDVHRFPGWGPGNFFAWETTVCVRR